MNPDPLRRCYGHGLYFASILGSRTAESGEEQLLSSSLAYMKTPAMLSCGFVRIFY